MKVLVTGGCGFIGSHLAEHFSTEAHVIVLDNLSRTRTYRNSIPKEFDSTYNLRYLRSLPNIEIVKGDIRNRRIVEETAQGVDLIIHTSAQVAVTTSLKDPLYDFEVNALGSLNILEAARQNDSIVEFCSTNKVYGENVNKISVKEDDIRYSFNDENYVEGISEIFPIDLTCHSPYGCSNLAADIYTQDYSHTYGLKTAVFRLSCIYGPRQFGVEDQGWIAWLTAATLTGKPITIYGDGKQVRDILYVTDLVDAFKKYVENPTQHEVFNLGGGSHNTLSLLELILLLEKLTGYRSEVKYKPWRPADQKIYISNIRRAESILGWHPTVSPQQGIERLVTWLSKILKK